MTVTKLMFSPGPGVSPDTWDVWEVHPTGGKSFSGELKRDPNTGKWIFTSSDDTIRWTLGRDVRKVKTALRKRYHPPDHSDLCGCVARV